MEQENMVNGAIEIIVVLDNQLDCKDTHVSGMLFLETKLIV